MLLMHKLVFVAQTGGCGGSLHLAPAVRVFGRRGAGALVVLPQAATGPESRTGNALAKRLRAGDLSGAKRDMGRTACR